MQVLLSRVDGFDLVPRASADPAPSRSDVEVTAEMEKSDELLILLDNSSFGNGD